MIYEIGEDAIYLIGERWRNDDDVYRSDRPYKIVVEECEFHAVEIEEK